MSVRVSALIVSYNTRELTLEALASLASEPSVETIVVDNASTDGTANAMAERFPSVKLTRSERNLGFAAGVNLAARDATAEYLLLLNPDAALSEGALGTLLAFLDAHPRAGVVGARLVYGDGRHQASAFSLPGLAQVALDLFPVPRLMETQLNGRVRVGQEPVRIGFPLGACMLIRRAAWEDVGPLDEGFFMYVEEVDWCHRARDRGWEVWHHPGALVVHHAGQSTRQRRDAMFVQLWRSRLHYYDKHFPLLYRSVVRMLLRAGMRAEAHRAGRELKGAALAARLEAVKQVEALAR